MKMDSEEFKSRYGKIRYLERIDCRKPVQPLGKKDINRELMIKFKYGNLTGDEENAFHDAIKKMIFKVMHKNNIMMDWDDVYQEIWKKICKSRHTWKEWKGTMVSTWITIVANSVINTLRQTLNRYNSRFVLYDDVIKPSETGDRQQQDKCDIVSFNRDEDRMMDSGIRKLLWNEQYAEFRSKLDGAERLVFDIALSMQDDIIDAYDNRLKMPYKELRARSGYDEATFAMIIYHLKRKYCEAFGISFNEDGNDSSDDGSGTEFLF